jgi:hypothetical protein
MHHHIDPVERTFEKRPSASNLSESGMIPTAFASIPSSETMA